MSLLIRGATMIDGLGHEPKRADVLVKDGKIADIGDIKGQAEQTIDAGGLTLTPGIVDVHTHYDAQVTWDATLSPSPSLGVTTAVMGNCGFGIAPALPQSRDLVIKNLSVVEGMDLDALRTGIKWDFESFSDYMAMLRRRAPYANVAVLAGHSTIRTAVMGEAASQRKDATPEEIAKMKAMVGDTSRFPAMAENAARIERRGLSDGARADALFGLWTESRGHRNNLMSRNYAFVATGAVARGDGLWAVQIFWAAPRESTLFP